ncbi:MAG: hypothetical protein ABF617_11575 [Gluconobacter japonicus]|uniref:hypothetical protein n=1 Tax=Gluconobacter japonicus TaxID=376620 RepID=UPI0039E88367
MHTHSSAPVAPSALTNNPISAPATLHAAAQLSMLSPEEAPEALMGTSFTDQEKNHILAAVRRGRMRLVDMPVLDSAGVTGQTISVTTAGLTQSVVLTGQFQHLILPIAEAAQVTVAPLTIPHAPVLDIVAMTALGPEALPGMTALDQSIVLDVIVQ